MPLTQEQFKKARDSGFTTEQIIAFEKKREGGTATMEEPQESPMREAYREGLGQSAHGISQIAFGAPEFLANKINPKLKEAVFPEPRTSGGKTLRAATDIYSMFGGGAAKLATKTAMSGIKGGVKELATKGLMEKAGRAAKSGAVYGGTQLDPESTVGGQALKAAGGAAAGAGLTMAGGAAVKTAQTLGGLPKGFKAIRNEPEFARRVQRGFFGKKRQAVINFGDEIKDFAEKNPERTTSIREKIENLIMKSQDNPSILENEPKLRSIINRSPKLKSMFSNPELSDNLSVKDLQDIINDISSKLPSSKKSGFNVNSDDIAVFDFLDDLRSAQLDAFPEMGKIKEAYREVIEPYNLIKGKIREGKILKNLATKFGDPQLNERAESLMTKDLKVEVDAYRRTKNLLKTMGLVGKNAGIAAGAGAGAGLLFGSR